MNALSWLIYLANLADSVSTLGILIAIALCIAALAFIISGALARDEALSRDSDSWKAGKRLQQRAPKLIVTAFIIGAIICFVPSKTTIMMIATSQFGQAILATDQGQKISGEAGDLAADSLALLHKYIKEQLGSSSQEPSK